MSSSVKPTRLSRYRDIAALVLKYRRSDLARVAGADDPEPAALPLEAEREAEALAADLERLGPTFVKLGQLLGSRSDVLPPAALDALARLQDDVAPFDFVDVERIVEEDLGVRISRAFASFDETPLAAASLGQVHRATLRDGRSVAVKVQRPGIREQVMQDLEAFDTLAGVLDRRTRAGERYRFGELTEQFRKTLLAELDYRREAHHMVLLSRNLRRFPTIVVPQPVEDFSATRVLTMDYVQGTKVTALSPVAFTEVDGEALANTLFRAYLKQVFVDGFFHADPHPGNVFLTGDGRIALLDVGMVARLSPRLQQRLLQLTLAVADGRSDEAADYALKISDTSPGFDERGFRRRLNDVVAASQDLTMGKLRVGTAFMDLARSAGASGVHAPPELTLLGKTLLQLDAIGRTIAPEFDPNASVRRNSVKLMNQRMLKSFSPASLFSTVLEMKDLVDRLPARLNRVLDSAANNELGIRVDTGIDSQQFMVGLQKVANRVAIGLVLAALIVGAALLMQVETSWRILGYPGLAMLCFLLAAGGGVFLLVHTVIKDVK